MEKIRNDSVEKRNLLLCCLLAFSTYRSPRWSARRARSASPGPGGRDPPRPADEVCPSAAPFLDSVCPVAELPPNLLKLRILFEKRDRVLVPGNSVDLGKYDNSLSQFEKFTGYGEKSETFGCHSALCNTGMEHHPQRRIGK